MKIKQYYFLNLQYDDELFVNHIGFLFVTTNLTIMLKLELTNLKNPLYSGL